MSVNVQNRRLQTEVAALVNLVGELGARITNAEVGLAGQVEEGDGFPADLEGVTMPVGGSVTSEPCLFDLAYLTENGSSAADSGLYVYYPRVNGGIVIHSGVSCPYDRDHREIFDPQSQDTFLDDSSWMKLGVESGPVYLNVCKRESDSRYVWWLGTSRTDEEDSVSVQLGDADAHNRRVCQMFHGILVLGGGVKPGPDSDAVAKYLGGTGYTAAEDTWTYGDSDSTTGLPTYPVFNPTRLYWWEDQHKLLCFRRTMTFNPQGLLVEVSAETLDPTPSVFTTVAEMP